MITKEEIDNLGFELITSELDLLRTILDDLENIHKDKKCSEENYWRVCSIEADLGIIKDKMLRRIFNYLKRGDILGD